MLEVGHRDLICRLIPCPFFGVPHFGVGNLGYLKDGAWYESISKAMYTMLLMVKTLHDLVYQNSRNYGSIVYVESCRIYIINSMVISIQN